jgi:hypothetical protein
MKVAQQTIYHDAERPSHILLPVIPSRGARQSSSEARLSADDGR